MARTGERIPTRIGDVMVVSGHAVGDRPREGEILEIVGEPGHEHYRIRWEDGHESIFYPSSDAHVRRAVHSR